MMDQFLSLEESRELLWSIQDFPIHMAAGDGDITCERRFIGLDVFWESESESQSEVVVVSEAEFARPQPPIQHKIQSLLLDMDIGFGRRILVQFWAPIRTASGQIMLTASHQPFGIGDFLYEELRRFRKYCAEHQYVVSEEGTTLLGPPGRVFTLGFPELCPDVRHYSREEFPLKKHALDCGIRCYAAIPLFQRDDQCCVGVLELSALDEWFSSPLIVVPLEKYDIEQGCKWDKTPPSFTPEMRQTIHSLAQYVEQRHQLRLVQVWVPCLCHIAPDATSSGQYDAHNCCSSSNPASPTPINRLFRDYFTPSYIYTTGNVAQPDPLWVRNDTSLVGRAYSQKKPCFVRDFSQFNIFDCPLLPFLRWVEVEACFAIPLQLIHPKFDPFVLELFLPRGKTWCDRNPEAMLESLLLTLKEECSAILGFASGSTDEVIQQQQSLYPTTNVSQCQSILDPISMDQAQVEKFSVKLSHWEYDNIAYLDVYQNGSSDATAQKRLNDHPNTTGETAMVSSSRGVEVSPNATEADRIQINGSSDATARKRDYSGLDDYPNATGDKAKTSCSREAQVGVPPNAAEPEIPLGDIQQYFGLKLNDAAEKLGVSRSTLKRRCREHGIKSWQIRNVHHIQSSPGSLTRFVEGGAEVIQESEIEPPCPNNNQTERDAAASDTIPKSAKGKNIAAQDEMDLDHSYTMIVKATYKDDIVMFPLGSNSGIEELRRELDERFEFKADRFKIKYKAKGDWILLSCDKDLRFRMDNLKSSGQTRMDVSIFPATL